LEFLDVGFSRVTDDGFENLADLTELKWLGFGGNKMSGVALPLLQLLPALAHLDVGGLQRTDSGRWGLALSDFNLESIEALTKLESLDLQDAKVTDLGLQRLSALSNLEMLDLSRTPLTGRGIKALTSLPKLKSLKLWQCEQVADGIAEHLPALKRVEVLDLAETSVTDEVLKAAGRMPSLKQLFVGGTKITSAAVERFRTEHPAIRVAWWETPPDPKAEEPDET
jgi:Leucine-rich repeat (LRR) protein